MKYDFKLNIEKSMKHRRTGRRLRGKRIMGVASKPNELGVCVVERGGEDGGGDGGGFKTNNIQK